MAGLDPAIHDFLLAKTWMPGTRPGMTVVDEEKPGELELLVRHFHG